MARWRGWLSMACPRIAAPCRERAGRPSRNCNGSRRPLRDGCGFGRWTDHLESAHSSCLCVSAHQRAVSKMGLISELVCEQVQMGALHAAAGIEMADKSAAGRRETQRRAR